MPEIATGDIVRRLFTSDILMEADCWIFYELQYVLSKQTPDVGTESLTLRFQVAE